MNNTEKLKVTTPFKALNLPKPVKNYWLTKYNFLVRNNGREQAYAIFKDLRVAMMNFIANPQDLRYFNDRFASIQWPVKRNKALKNLCHLALSNPHEVILMLKLYTMEESPVKDLREAEIDHITMLANANQISDKHQRNIDEIDAAIEKIARFAFMHPSHIDHLIVLCEKGLISMKLGNDKYQTPELYYNAHYLPRKAGKGRRQLTQGEKDALFFVAGLILKKAAYSHWEYFSRRGRISSSARVFASQGDPRINKKSFRKVFYHLLITFKSSLEPLRKKLNSQPRAPMTLHYPSKADYSVFYSSHPDRVERAESQHREDYYQYQRIMADLNNMGPHLRALDPGQDIDLAHSLSERGRDTSPLRVGKIEYIPKTGTLDYRPIANPNRFLQMAQKPFAELLYSILSVMPGDCTFNQSRLFHQIYTGVQNNKAASVDLSKATDYLPYQLGRTIGRVLGMYYPRSERYDQIRASYEVFDRMIDSLWLTPTNAVSWLRGQPLGAIASFATLGLTQNFLAIYASLLSLKEIKPHLHRYAILGDDMVTWNDTQDILVWLYERMGCPISYHKSYSGRLAEFAGTLFIRNNGYRYSTDLKEIHLSSLLDWQRATRTPVPYHLVAGKLHRAFPKTSIPLKDVYTAIQLYSDVYSEPVHMRRLGSLSERALEFLAALYVPEADKPEGLALEAPNWVETHDGHLRHLGIAKIAPANKGWFHEKFRPSTPRALVRKIERVMNEQSAD